MKNTITLSFLLAFAISVQAQTKWIRKKFFSDIEVQFPVEPMQVDYGSNTNWMAYHDSTVFQLSRIKSEDKNRSSYRNCHMMLQGILDESKGKILDRDSIRINNFCAISFRVQPGVEELAGMEMKGLVLDKNDKSFILMTTSAKKKSKLVDHFISSFKIR